MMFLPRLVLVLPLLAGLLSCSGAGSAPMPTTVATAPSGATAAALTPTALSATTEGGSSASAPLSPSCVERVEGASTSGECADDAGCTKAGCSQEVCVPTQAVADIMTTCERLPCFQRLDTCGCHEGVCSWTLKAGPTLTQLPGLVPAAPAPVEPAPVDPADAPQ